jgi:hypothetical protein
MQVTLLKQTFLAVQEKFRNASMGKLKLQGALAFM